jgi:putative transposase
VPASDLVGLVEDAEGQDSVGYRRTWATRQELRLAIVTWIERTYHRLRRQAALG